MTFRMGLDNIATPIVTLAQNDWEGSEINNAVCKILLEEKLGIKTVIRPIGAQAQWPFIAEGDISAVLEVWPSGHTANYDKYIVADGTVE